MEPYIHRGRAIVIDASHIMDFYWIYSPNEFKTNDKQTESSTKGKKFDTEKFFTNFNVSNVIQQSKANRSVVA